MSNRNVRKAMGEQTVAILKAGTYTTKSGKVVSIEAALAACIAGTRDIPPTETLTRPLASLLPSTSPAPHARGARIVEVTRESTLKAAERLYKMYHTASTSAKAERVLCLNFASAHNPGGGFLSGSQAQEESLARCSGLYASQTAHSNMYAFNGKLPHKQLAQPHTIYSDFMIYSPDVPVFRDDESGELLEEPFPVTIVSAPAPNAGATLNTFGKAGASESVLWEKINTAMEHRLTRVLTLAVRERIDVLVLGAYGCGVFKNKPSTVAQCFHSLLGEGGPFEKDFKHVVFAVYANDESDKTYMAFRQQLQP